MGKRVKIEAKLEKPKRDWELEIGLLMKMDGQKVEKLREVKKELVLLEKLILKLRQQVEQKDEAKMTREQNWDEYRQYFGDWALPPIPKFRQLRALHLLPKIYPLCVFRQEFICQYGRRQYFWRRRCKLG